MPAPDTEPEVRTEAQLLDELTRASTAGRRKYLYGQAVELRLEHQIPDHWNSDGTMRDKEAE